MILKVLKVFDVFLWEFQGVRGFVVFSIGFCCVLGERVFLKDLCGFGGC